MYILLRYNYFEWVKPLDFAALVIIIAEPTCTVVHGRIMLGPFTHFDQHNLHEALTTILAHVVGLD